MRDEIGLDREKLAALQQREDADFLKRTAKSQAHLAKAASHMPDGVPMPWMVGLYKHPPMVVDRGEGSRFWDIDGNVYLDMNQADLSATCGFTPGPVVRAVCERMAKGAQFLLPTEDAAAVAKNLASRFGLPAWQFTLSATVANSEALRIARLATGREKILIFGGRYHGLLDDTLVAPEDGTDPSAHGLPGKAGGDTRLVSFNDLAAAEKALSAGDVACAITEPALTNCGVVRPDPDFLGGLYELTRRYGSLLILDEAHTQMSAYGGLKREWGLKADIVTMGKSIAGGIALGAYGVTAELAAIIEANLLGDFINPDEGLATGGTLAGNALSMAAARATLEEVMTEAGYARMAALGERLADGLESLFGKYDLPWCAHRLGGRSGFCLRPEWPRNYEAASHSLDLGFIAARKIYMANRGIWDAIASAGPAASFAHVEADIDHYLSCLDEFFGEIT